MRRRRSRALAQRSADAAKEIKVLISTSSQQVTRGVSLVGATGEALNGIMSKVARIDALISEIASSSKEQATGLAEVNTAVNQMDQVTQQNAAMVEEASAAAERLRAESGELRRLIGQFRVGAEPARVRSARPAPEPRRAPGGLPVRQAQQRVQAAFGGGRAEAWEEF